MAVSSLANRLTKRYILEGREVREVSEAAWYEWMAGDFGRRRIAVTELNDAVVSTVFLPMDHGFDGDPPILFETLVFGGPLDGELERYRTSEEAERGHAAMVERVKAALDGECHAQGICRPTDP